MSPTKISLLDRQNPFAQKPISMARTCVVLVAVAVTCAGCVYGPQQVRVAPELNQTGSTEGAGKTVKLSVSDERASKTLGQTDEGDVFTLKGKVPNVVESTIRTALEKQGFTVSRNPKKSAASLDVEIRILEYDIKPGFPFKSVHAKSEISAACKSTSGAEFAKPYGSVIDRNAFFLFGEGDGESLSAAVSDSIEKLLAEKALGNCLIE